MGESISSLRLTLRSLISLKPWTRDADVVNLPYREEELSAAATEVNLAFGLMKDDGIVRPHPPIARAIAMVSEALSEAGHQVLQLMDLDANS